jgi:diacylglycerol kinase family enzyme
VLRERRFRYEPAAELDDGERVAWAVVTNGRIFTYAGAFPLKLAPRARFELGLDVVAPRRITPASIPRLAGYLATGIERLRGPGVAYYHDVDRAELRADRPLPLQADGEDLGDVEHAVFECERAAVSVLV